MALVDPHSYADPSQGRVTRLGLILDVDFKAKRLSGTATLGLEGAKGGNLDLDTRDLDIRKVVLGDGTELEFTLGEKDEVLGQKLSVNVPDQARTRSSSTTARAPRRRRCSGSTRRSPRARSIPISSASARRSTRGAWRRCRTRRAAGFPTRRRSRCRIRWSR